MGVRHLGSHNQPRGEGTWFFEKRGPPEKKLSLTFGKREKPQIASTRKELRLVGKGEKKKCENLGSKNLQGGCILQGREKKERRAGGQYNGGADSNCPKREKPTGVFPQVS